MSNRVITLITLPALVLLIGTLFNSVSTDTLAARNPAVQPPEFYHYLFKTSDSCISCHNGLVTSSGEDISFGTDWAATMMANSARDPYWHAAVRREVMDHPESQSVIENECSTCHMPMAHYEAIYNGQTAQVFTHLPINSGVSRANLLAADGVSCTSCHQITEEKLGTPESFVGRFAMDTLTSMGARQIFGPYPVDNGLSKIMHSSSGFLQKESKHIQLSEMCATCHTLITESLGPDGEIIGELPEQVPYQEWKHSSFSDNQSCQSCHMPVVQDKTAISSVMGTPREEVSRHTFQGGNFFMLKMLNRYRDELGVQAQPRAMDNAVNRTIEHLQTQSARIEILELQKENEQLRVAIAIRNLAGHKLPTAYPSRRSWIHFTVKDQAGNIIFESGSLRPNGSITGNDNDDHPDRFEPHYTEITQSGQVQIYEAIMADPSDRVTTGLLTATHFIKDNRILPDGFDKTTAGEQIEVHGNSYEDANFIGGEDLIWYRVNISKAEGPLQISAELWYQPVGYRWAQNLRAYEAEETNRFVRYYDSMSDNSAVKLTGTSQKYVVK